MKRRGARVVSAGSTLVVPSESTGAAPRTLSSSPLPTSPASHAYSGEAGAAASLTNATTGATLTIPTLNIFARFQSHREDFDADWLLLKEDPLTGSEKPPIAAHVADKLRRHQAQLGAHRAAAAADRSAAAAAAARQGKDAPPLAAVSVRESLTPVEPSTAQRRRRQRRPDTYDSAEEEEAQSGADAVTAAVAAESVITVEVGNAGEEEEEYMPEDRKAAQYRHARDAASVASAGKARKTSSRTPPPLAVPVDANPAASPLTATPPSTGEVSTEAVAEANEGLTGDYLNFQSSHQGGSKALGADALQATVRLPPPSSPQSQGTGSASFPRGQQQQQQRRPHASGKSGEKDRVLVVPLWSTARMEQHGGYCRSSPLIALHQEVSDLVDYLRPTEAEVTMRRFIEMEVGKLVDRLWPGSRVLVYGSMYTHLLLPLSDLDMTLIDVPVPADEALTALAKEISNAGLCENAYPQVILKTKVPLIKFAHAGSLIDVDISVGAVDGKRNSECVIRYLNTYPEALPLVMIVKYLLIQRGMHEPYHGGLGSYAATLLVVAFLRQHPIYTTNPEQRPMTGLGKLFVDFLRMCGQFWSYSRVAVALGDLHIGAVSAHSSGGEEGDFRPRQDMDRSSHMQSPVSPMSPRTPLGPAQGSIEDPVDATNNAASSLRLFHSLSSMFTYAYLAVTADFDAATAASMPSGGGGPDGASVGNSVTPETISPSISDISRRPTLLSRIFHVDADMVFRRQAIAAAYARLSTDMPAYMDDVRLFRREEDAAMLPHNAQSWQQRRQLRRGGEAAFLWERGADTASLASSSAQAARVVTSLEERLALARLHESAMPSAAKEPLESSDSGQARKRRRGEDDADVIKRKEEYSAPSASSSVSDGDSVMSGSDSNASSVRVDVSKSSQRRRRMRQE